MSTVRVTLHDVVRVANSSGRVSFYWRTHIPISSRSCAAAANTGRQLADYFPSRFRLVVHSSCLAFIFLKNHSRFPVYHLLDYIYHVQNSQYSTCSKSAAVYEATYTHLHVLHFIPNIYIEKLST